MAQFCVHCGVQLHEDGAFCHACGKSKVGSVTGSSGVAAQAVMAPKPEKTFLQDGGVTVTNSRFIVPEQTYAMAGVTSVRSATIEPKRGWPIIICLFGALTLAGSIAFGLFLLVIGIMWLVCQKTKYAVALNSASGEVRAITSENSEYISGIVNALNDAIVYRR